MKQNLFILLALFLGMATSCSIKDEVLPENNVSTPNLILDWNNLEYIINSAGYKAPLIYAPNCSYVVYKIADEEKLFAKLRAMGLTINEKWIGGDDLEWNTGIYANTRRLYRLDGILPEELIAMNEVVYASHLAFYGGYVLPLFEAVTIMADVYTPELLKLASYCRVECTPIQGMGTAHRCILTKISTVNNVEFIHLCKDNKMNYVLQPYIDTLYHSATNSWVHGGIGNIQGVYYPEWSFDLVDWYIDKLKSWNVPVAL